MKAELCHIHAPGIWKQKKNVPMPGIEPGPSGWKPDILATRPHGILGQPMLYFSIYLRRLCAGHIHIQTSTVLSKNVSLYQIFKKKYQYSVAYYQTAFFLTIFLYTLKWQPRKSILPECNSLKYTYILKSKIQFMKQFRSWWKVVKQLMDDGDTA